MLFLEDVRNVQARSRQEKLAAMGRVSAGIAHEIRNPLAAIAQANALLAEDATDAGAAPADAHGGRQRRAPEAHRRRRDGGGARAGVQEVGAIDATAQVGAVCGEWARAAGVALGEQSVLQVELPAEPLGVLFDAEHLRRVLVNLLDNALPPRQRARPARSSCALCARRRAARRAQRRERRRADPARRRALPVRAVLLDAQPRHRTGPVYLPRAVRALRRAASTTGCAARRARAAQRVLRRRCAAPPLPTRRSPTCTSPHDHRLALQPARRRRRARPAHAVRADAAARGLRRRDRRHGRRRRCCI